MTSPSDHTPMIEAFGLEKVYRVYHQYGRGWLKSVLFWFLDPARFSQEVEALKGIDLRVERGEVVGILGRNGAGKSTLLRIVAGLTRPTGGRVTVNGEVRALLSLGIGFYPRFTGRENIIFGSLAMGIPRKITSDRVDQITDFAELQDSIDLPVQFYSTGMRARLAAAVAFQDAPEILIIDEALAAGDGYFVNKCRRRIAEICESGSTVLLVTHGPSLVERFCTRAIIIDSGRLVSDGKPSEIAARYKKMLLDAEELQLAAAGKAHPARIERDAADPSSVTSGALTSGQGMIEILGVQMMGQDGQPTTLVGHREPLELHIAFRTRQPIADDIRFFVQLYSQDYGVRLAETGSVFVDAATGKRSAFYPRNLDGEYVLKMKWPRNPLGGGTYYWDIFLAPKGSQIAYETPALYYVKLHHACLFRSVSFPGEQWAVQRKSVLEPESEFELVRADRPSLSLKAKR